MAIWKASTALWTLRKAPPRPSSICLAALSQYPALSSSFRMNSSSPAGLMLSVCPARTPRAPKIFSRAATWSALPMPEIALPTSAKTEAMLRRLPLESVTETPSDRRYSRTCGSATCR